MFAFRALLEGAALIGPPNAKRQRRPLATREDRDVRCCATTPKDHVQLRGRASGVRCTQCWAASCVAKEAFYFLIGVSFRCPNALGWTGM